MKLMSVLIILAICIAVIFVFKVNAKDNNARKEAVPVTAKIIKLRCKQRLKSDKSLMILQFQSQQYTVFVSEKECNSYTLNQEITAYHAKSYNKLFLHKK